MAVILNDTTLRDGLQAPNALLDARQRRDLAEALIACGFCEIEAGIPARGSQDIEFISSLRRSGLRVTSWCRARMEDLEAAARTESAALHISAGLSDRQLAVLGRDRSDMEDALFTCLGWARERFDFVSLGLMDATRCPDDLLLSFMREAFKAGASRLRLADTVGIATPTSLIAWARRFRPYLAKLEFHAHNDLGMASANAHTAALSGFGALSGTLAGLGERSGNACWEELLVALRQSGADFGNVDIKSVLALSRRLRSMLGEAIPARQPLLGEYAFAHESGLHVSGLAQDPLSYQFCRPQDLGLDPPRILFGPQSGAAALGTILAREGIRLGRQALEELARRLGREALARGRPLERADLLRLSQSMKTQGEKMIDDEGGLISWIQH